MTLSHVLLLLAVALLLAAGAAPTVRIRRARRRLVGLTARSRGASPRVCAAIDAGAADSADGLKRWAGKMGVTEADQLRLEAAARVWAGRTS